MTTLQELRSQLRDKAEEEARAVEARNERVRRENLERAQIALISRLGDIGIENEIIDGQPIARITEGAESYLVAIDDNSNCYGWQVSVAGFPKWARVNYTNGTRHAQHLLLAIDKANAQHLLLAIDKAAALSDQTTHEAASTAPAPAARSGATGATVEWVNEFLDAIGGVPEGDLVWYEIAMELARRIAALEARLEELESPPYDVADPEQNPFLISADAAERWRKMQP